MINVRAAGQLKTPDGKLVPIPPGVALFQRGPMLPVVIQPSPSFAAALTKAGKPALQPATGMALIDTGATSSCVDGEIAQRMGLAPNGTGVISSASHEKAETLTYPLRLQFPGWNVNLDCMKALAVPIAKQGFIALVGRDLLIRCLFVYNGPDGAYSLAL